MCGVQAARGKRLPELRWKTRGALPRPVPTDPAGAGAAGPLHTVVSFTPGSGRRA
ncbi:hypothetical protein Dvina_18395 [Dactylosporangium vinaceum]|uniref:Uncharacterized protein n=1 Tax=Dactylosporangium vinaceum TaxID=53362 RepID=A0ABV5M2V9_9ACTN|nr:hypothetical protein [Dactylosporangium vinaceum]UAB99852.1 hypothetical protein Dvina_18395 [Dactylosporangium vinaceum]